MKRVTILLTALLAAFSSCMEDPLISGEQAFCNIRDGRMYTDEGLTYNVVDWSSEAIWDTLKRAYIYCDVVKKVSETEYNIHLRYFEKVYLLDGVNLSECKDSLVGTDPICFYQGWIADNSERYLNLRFLYLYYNAAHSVNMVYDDLTSTKDTIKFQIRHNASGETMDCSYSSMLKQNTGFLTLPLEGYLPSDRDSVVIRLDYDWYATQGGYYTSSTDHGHIEAKIATTVGSSE